MGKSTKPGKPSKDFPLFPHDCGRWAKKVKQRLVYFSRWGDDPRGEEALRLWNAEKDEIYLTGRRAAQKTTDADVDACVNLFLESKRLAVETGEITERHYRDMKTTCTRIVRVLGRHTPLAKLTPADFARLKADIVKARKSLTTLGNEIVRVKAPFRWAKASGLVDVEVKFGPDFNPPPKGKIRAERNAKRGRGWIFTAQEVTRLIDAAGVHMKAMIYLAVQAGFGPTDCARLPLTAMDIDGGWIDFPRPKTGIARRVPLWPETAAALRDSLAKRPAPKTEAAQSTFFVTKAGDTWGDAVGRFPVSAEFGKLLRSLELEREGRGIYGLRHTFRTIAGRCRDIEAIRAVMGHTSEHVESNYIHDVDDDRLRAVVDTVRVWLLSATQEGGAQ